MARIVTQEFYNVDKPSPTVHPPWLPAPGDIGIDEEVSSIATLPMGVEIREHTLLTQASGQIPLDTIVQRLMSDKEVKKWLQILEHMETLGDVSARHGMSVLDLFFLML